MHLPRDTSVSYRALRRKSGRVGRVCTYVQGSQSDPQPIIYIWHSQSNKFREDCYYIALVVMKELRNRARKSWSLILIIYPHNVLAKVTTKL